MTSPSTISSPKRIRIDPNALTPVEQQKPEPLELTELPTDMIDIITSFSLLMDIINLEKTCKLFENTCKRNTHEIIQTKFYKKYLNYYHTQKNESNKSFKLKDIKKLHLILNDTCNKFCELIMTTIKFHSNLKYFQLHFGLLLSHRLTDSFSKILPNNFLIDKLNLNMQWNDKLILQSKTVKFSNIKFTLKKFEILIKSQINSISFYNCYFDGNIKKINVKNWISLKECHFYFEDTKENCNFIYQTILLHAPNVSKLFINTKFYHGIVPEKVSNKIKTLIFSSFNEVLCLINKLKIYRNFFNNMRKANHKFESIHLSFDANNIKKLLTFYLPKFNDTFQFVFDVILDRSKYVILFGGDKRVRAAFANYLKLLDINKVIQVKDETVGNIMISKISNDTVQIQYGVSVPPTA